MSPAPPATPIERRITELEKEAVEQKLFKALAETRFADGAKAFAEVREGRKWWTWALPVLSLLLAAYIAFGDRTERASKVELDKLRETVQEIQVRQAKTEQLLQEVDRGIRRIEEGQRALNELVAGMGRRRK